MENDLQYAILGNTLLRRSYTNINNPQYAVRHISHAMRISYGESHISYLRCKYFIEKALRYAVLFLILLFSRLCQRQVSFVVRRTKSPCEYGCFAE